MELGRRVGISALVGVIAVAGWMWSYYLSFDLWCPSKGPECLGLMLVGGPLTMSTWMLLVWPMVWIAGIRPAWPIAVLGAVLAVAAFLSALAGLTVGSNPVVMTFVIGAGVYALAAATTWRRPTTWGSPDA